MAENATGDIVPTVPGTPEHDAAMAAKAKEGGVTINNQPAGNEGDPAVPQRPEHIPEKFWNAEKGEADYEALAKSYAELEKKLGEKPPEPRAEPGKQPSADEAAALREKATAEFTEKGELTPETYAAYEKLGVTHEQIDAYIEGQKAIVAARQSEAWGIAGGEEQYKALIQWAATALNKAEIEAYDRDINATDAQLRQQTVKGLLGRYQAEFGKDSVIRGGTPAGAGGDHFTSKAEMVKAMSSPEYKKSPAFREEVARKTSAALRAGVNLGLG